MGCRILYIPKPVSGIYSVEYGLLYNSYTIESALSLTSSADWAVPTDAQLTTLSTYLGGTSVAGGKIREIGTTYWNSDPGCTNSALFNFRGAGIRNYSPM